MLLVLTERALEHGVEALTLEVRPSNAPAVALYGRFGFAPVGVRKNYYRETNEDALVMWADRGAERSYRGASGRHSQVASRSRPQSRSGARDRAASTRARACSVSRRRATRRRRPWWSTPTGAVVGGEQPGRTTRALRRSRARDRQPGARRVVDTRRRPGADRSGHQRRARRRRRRDGRPRSGRLIARRRERGQGPGPRVGRAVRRGEPSRSASLCRVPRRAGAGAAAVGVARFRRSHPARADAGSR